MSRTLFAGLFVEGPTDQRFLSGVVKRTLDDLAMQCTGDIEVELVPIEIEKSGKSFVDQVKTAARKGLNEFGLHFLCVHTDADRFSDQDVFENKIIPAQKELELGLQTQHFSLIPIVPIVMTEAWMLADKELLKSEIGTDLSDGELQFTKNPERYSDPKDIINNAIRIADASRPKKTRYKVTIQDLYQIVGQRCSLQKLSSLSSYQKFRNGIIAELGKMNYLHY